MNKLLLAIVSLIPVYSALSMELLPTKNTKEKAETAQSILAEIKKAKHEQEIVFIQKVMIMGKKNPINNFDRDALNKITRKASYLPLLTHFIKSLDSTERSAEFKSVLLEKADLYQNFEAVKILLAHGAYGNGLFHRVLDSYHRANLAYIPFILRNSQEPEHLTAAAQKWIDKQEWCEARYTHGFGDRYASYEDARVASALFYYGLKVPTPTGTYFKDFLTQAHAHRVFRLACYLHRCILGKASENPNEKIQISSLENNTRDTIKMAGKGNRSSIKLDPSLQFRPFIQIAEHVYGPLNDQQKKFLDQSSMLEYKKSREKK